jgi:hypothetical protein
MGLLLLLVLTVCVATRAHWSAHRHGPASLRNEACNVRKSRDGFTLVSFARHTARGVTKDWSSCPLEILAPDLPVVSLPLLAYGYANTPRGIEVAQQFGAPGLQAAAAASINDLQSLRKKKKKVLCLSVLQNFLTRGLLFSTRHGTRFASIWGPNEPFGPVCWCQQHGGSERMCAGQCQRRRGKGHGFHHDKGPGLCVFERCSQGCCLCCRS